LVPILIELIAKWNDDSLEILANHSIPFELIPALDPQNAKVRSKISKGIS